MNKKILKINSWISIIFYFLLILLSTCAMILAIITPSRPDSWDILATFIFVIGTIIVYVINLPLLISAISTLCYLKGKNTYIISMIFNVLGIILYGLIMFLFIYLDILNIFADSYNGHVDVGLKIKFSIIIFFLFVCPLLINMIGLNKEKNNLTYKALCHRYRFIIIGIIVIIFIIICYNLFKNNIINTNKIEITEDNTYSYFDFKSQLESRKFIPLKKTVVGFQNISALDSKSKYGYYFSNGPYTDFFNLSVNTDRKFPMFVYESYTSLIKKSDKTANYYSIGPEDWYITWYIYYVDGKIYAAIDKESEYGKNTEVSLSKTKYGIIVSEEKDITIYNSKNNYYVKGGGILDTRSGTQRNEFPTTTDIYNGKCMKIRVVDKVDAKTLDEIAKELSPQYWKIYENR